MRPEPRRPMRPRISPGRNSRSTSGVLTLACQAAHLQHRLYLARERGFKAAFEHVTGDQFAQAAPVQVAHPVGAQVAPVAQHGHALGNGHDLVEPMADKHRGDALTLQFVNDGQKRIDFLMGQRSGWLVHDDQPCLLPHQRPTDGHQLARGDGQRPNQGL